MSASDKKRQRKANAANMTPRQKEAQKEAKTLKIYTWSFWVIVILCAAIVAGMALHAPVDGIVRNNTTAIQVGNQTMSAVELNYFYVDEINTYCQNYSSYLSYMIDTSKSIGDQYYDEAKKITWADNFLTMTIESIKDTYALYNAAQAAKFELPAAQKDSLTSLKSNLKTYANYYGYGSISKYLVSIYGNGANEKSYLSYYEKVLTANAYHDAYAEDLKESYTPAQLRDYEKETPYKYNSYTYASFMLSLDKFKVGGTKDKDGKVTYTDEQMTAFRAELKAAAEKLASKDNNTSEKLNAAIKALEIELAKKQESKSSSTTATTANTTTKPTTANTTANTTKPTTSDKKEPTYSTAVENKDTLYSNITTTIQEWVRDDARKEGDITFIANTVKETKDGKEVDVVNGYYIVLFKSMNKNEYALANVRHVLIPFEGGTPDSTTGQTTYSEVEKKAAKSKADKIYEDWKKAGDLSEKSFAELAKKNSKDNAEDGGLYEDVYPGQMVSAYNDWCFDDARKPGDTGIVESEYGYHIMFYVGDSETSYRDYMITNDKQTEEVAAWKADLIKKVTLVTKNTKHINRDMMLNTQSSGY